MPLKSRVQASLQSAHVAVESEELKNKMQCYDEKSAVKNKISKYNDLITICKVMFTK